MGEPKFKFVLGTSQFMNWSASGKLLRRSSHPSLGNSGRGRKTNDIAGWSSLLAVAVVTVIVAVVVETIGIEVILRSYTGQDRRRDRSLRLHLLGKNPDK